MATVDALKLDPSRTSPLRNAFMSDMRRRIIALKKAIWDLIYVEDAFGLKPHHATVGQILRVNTRWAFRSNDKKLEEFNRWFQDQVESGLLSVDGNTGEPWTNTYVQSAYRQGVTRAFLEVNPEDFDAPAGFYQGSKAQFLRDSFNQPEAVSKLRLLYTRTFEDLRGFTSDMAAKANRTLAEGISNGNGASKIATALRQQVDISRPRAMTIARTEVMHAHNEGALDGYERLGISKLRFMVEWTTSGNPCPVCAPLGGVIMTVAEARGLFPRHPNCKCVPLPANVGEDQSGQKRTKSQIRKAILASVRKEKPNSKHPMKDSRWAGADKVFRAKRRK